MISLGLLLPTSRQGYFYTSTSEGTDIGLRSTTCVVYHGHVWCARGGGTFVYLLRPRRDSYGQAFSLYTFDNVNYVSWCTVRGASVFMLEYRSVDSAC